MELSESFLYENIGRTANDALIFTDREGVIRLWNAGSERMFGYTSQEAVGRSLDLIIPENLRSRHWEGYFRVMKTGMTKYQAGLLSSPGLTKDGTRLSLEFSIVIIRDEQGEIAGCGSIMRDVSARWQETRALKERLKTLEQGVRG